MATIHLEVTIPDSAPADGVADALHTLVDAAYRAGDWCDGLDWRITQVHDGELLVRVPFASTAVRA